MVEYMPTRLVCQLWYSVSIGRLPPKYHTIILVVMYMHWLAATTNWFH